MHLALFSSPVGTLYSSWRYPETKVNSLFDIKQYVKIAQAAEKAKLDMIFIADKLSIADSYGNDFNQTVSFNVSTWPEPLTLMATLAAVTEKIGVAGTVSSTFLQPYPIARMLASMDLFSKGRVGWNVVTSTSHGESRNFNSKEELLNHATRYEKAEEFIKVIKSLWDTWEDDAIKLDQSSGVVADANKVHYANFEGDYFTVKGPLNIPRPIQGHPVTIQAGGSTSFIELASKTADMIFAAEQPSLEAAQAFYKKFKAKVVKNGRNAHEVKVILGLTPIIGRSMKEAKEKAEMFLELQHPITTFTHLSSTMNYDWSQHHLDDLVPNMLDQIERKERFGPMIHHAVEKKMTLRQFAQYVVSHVHAVVGTPDTIADQMAKFYKEKAVDGYILMPSHIPGGAEEIFEQLVPELQGRGVFREDYNGETLRDHLGLPRPENKHQYSTTK